MNNKFQKWQHPGGKLRKLCAETLTDTELLSILVAPQIESLKQKADEAFEDYLGSPSSTPDFASASSTNSGKKLLSKITKI